MWLAPPPPPPPPSTSAREKNENKKTKPIPIPLNSAIFRSHLDAIISSTTDTVDSTSSGMACSRSAVGLFSELVVHSKPKKEDNVDSSNVEDNDDEDSSDSSSSSIEKKSTPNQENREIIKSSSSGVPSILLPLPDSTSALIAPSSIIQPTSRSETTPTTLLSVARSLRSVSDVLSGGETLVLLLRSGALAAAIFDNKTGEALVHTTKRRYTVRKGQGGSQGAKDAGGGGKAKSIGAQLRRDGEKKLWEDVKSTLISWEEHFPTLRYIFLGGSRSMIGAKLFDLNFGLVKTDERIRRVNHGVEKCTFDNLKLVYKSATMSVVRKMTDGELKMTSGQVEEAKESPPVVAKKEKVAEVVKVLEKVEYVEFGEVHTLVNELGSDDDVNVEETIARLDKLFTGDDSCVNAIAGPSFSTPLHLAAQIQNHASASKMVNFLLLHGADPTILDTHDRPPYYIASSDKVRDTFRWARGDVETFGHIDWDKAKVGPPLTTELVNQKKEKEKAKKKAQKERAKKRKEEERAEKQRLEEDERAQREKEEKEEEAKRIRAGLAEKSKLAENSCDFCGKECRRRRDMFERLDWIYCSTDCVKKHQRELSAAAALKRLG